MRSTLLLFSMAIILLSSCSSNEQNDSWVEGTWELTEWNLDFSVDIDKDGIASFNLLDEIACSNKETIKFDQNKVFTSRIEHQPNVRFYIADNTDAFLYDIECGEGIISTTGLNYVISGAMVEVNESSELSYVKEGNTLVRYIASDIKVYGNNNFTEVVATISTTKVFEKID